MDTVFRSRMQRKHHLPSWVPSELAAYVLSIANDPELILEYARAGGAPLVYALFNFGEQVPNPDSRVSLADEKDPFGLPRLTFDWRLSDIDKYALRRGHELIAAEVARSGYGRMRIDLPEEEEIILDGARGGPHHMGTTRMHDDPRQGVVDANLRMHGVENFFILGASTFPTGGWANPTLTAIAFSLRLADHLDRLMINERRT
jgi:choline dehydrogenase-like flavoprotein